MVKDRDLGLISLDSSPPCASFWLFVAFHILYLTVYSSFLSHEYPQKIQLQRSPKLGLWFQCYGNKNRPAKDIEAFYRAQHLFRTDRREKNRTGSPCKMAFQNANKGLASQSKTKQLPPTCSRYWIIHSSLGHFSVRSSPLQLPHLPLSSDHLYDGGSFWSKDLE